VTVTAGISMVAMIIG